MKHTGVLRLSLVKARQVIGIKNRAKFDRDYQKIEAQFSPRQREQLRSNLFGLVTKDSRLQDLQWHMVALVFIYSLPEAGAGVREKCLVFLAKKAAHYE